MIFSRLILLVITLLSTQLAFGGPKKTTTTPVVKTNPDSIHIAKYKLALKYGDTHVAIDAIYNLLLLHPDSIKYKDSLMVLYYVSGGYAQSLNFAKELSITRANDPKIMEITANCQQQLGQAKDALENFDKLYRMSNKVYFLYQEAVLQLNLQRYGECHSSLDIVIADKGAAKEKLRLSAGQYGTQEVLLKAAALNINGLCYQEEKDYNNAKKCYMDALAIDENFVLAKGNLDNLLQGLSQAQSQQKQK